MKQRFNLSKNVHSSKVVWLHESTEETQRQRGAWVPKKLEKLNFNSDFETSLSELAHTELLLVFLSLVAKTHILKNHCGGRHFSFVCNSLLLISEWERTVTLLLSCLCIPRCCSTINSESQKSLRLCVVSPHAKICRSNGYFSICCPSNLPNLYKSWLTVKHKSNLGFFMSFFIELHGDKRLADILNLCGSSDWKIPYWMGSD